MTSRRVAPGIWIWPGRYWVDLAQGCGWVRLWFRGPGWRWQRAINWVGYCVRYVPRYRPDRVDG